jgi:putative hydrolase of the HAD superfamily
LIRTAREVADVTERDFDAVFWDIGGVVLQMESVRACHAEFVRELVNTYESPHQPEEAIDTWRSTLGAYFNEATGTNYRPAQAGYERAVDAVLTADVDDVDWNSIYRDVYQEHSRPHSGAVDTIERLGDADLHLGVISDVDHEEGKAILANFGVLEYFDSVTSSEEVGRKKPDPAMFRTALDKAGVDAERAVMIGDRYSHDMEGGHEAGMTTIAYGADDGPAVDHRVAELSEILDVVGATEGQPSDVG